VAKVPINHYSDRNFNDTKKSEQCSNVTRKMNGSNNLGIWGQSPSRRRTTRIWG